MRVSIVIAILDSQEVARRQILHYNRLELPDDVEVIFVDDGSVPPLEFDDIPKNFNFQLYRTNNFRPWTQPAARNFGATQASGEYCICTDIDHIVSQDVIEYARQTTADVVRFKRQVAVLDADGIFTQDWETLRKWGYSRDRLRINAHSNSYIIKRDLFLRLGGSSEKHVNTGHYPNQEELPLKGKLHKLWRAGKIEIVDDETKPTIFMFPVGRHCGEKDYNPFGLFHHLSREKCN